MTGAPVVVFAALTMLSCSSTTPRTGPAIAISIRTEVTPVPLDPHDPSKRSVGGFVYAGGIELRGAAAAGAIFELSDLRIVSGDRLIAVSDHGTFFEARLLFDETGRLAGVADTRITT